MLIKIFEGLPSDVEERVNDWVESNKDTLDIKEVKRERTFKVTFLSEINSLGVIIYYEQK